MYQMMEDVNYYSNI